MKPRQKAAPTMAERAHMNRVADMGCIVCKRPAELHHTHDAPDQRRRRDHRYVTPLCADHHRGPEGIHGLGRHGFAEVYGVDLDQWAALQWEHSRKDWVYG